MKLAGRSEHTIVSHEKSMFSVHQFSRPGISHSHVPALAKKIPGGLQQCQEAYKEGVRDTKTLFKEMRSMF